MKTANTTNGDVALMEPPKAPWYHWHGFPLLPLWEYRPEDEWNTSSWSFSWLNLRVWSSISPDLEFWISLNDQGLFVQLHFLYAHIKITFLAFPESWHQKFWRVKYHPVPPEEAPPEGVPDPELVSKKLVAIWLPATEKEVSLPQLCDLITGWLIESADGSKGFHSFEKIDDVINLFRGRMFSTFWNDGTFKSIQLSREVLESILKTGLFSIPAIDDLGVSEDVKNELPERIWVHLGGGIHEV